MKITIAVECSTEDEALEVVQRIAGVEDAPTEEKSKPKKATPKQKAAEATEEEASPPKKPAPAKKKAAPKKKSGAPSEDDLKAHILEQAGDMTDPTIAGQVKEYVTSFGVSKISDMTDQQRQEAFDGAEGYFNGGDEVEEGEEEDPMA